MAKEPRHKRLYKDSPKLERSDDGNMKPTKGNDRRGEKASDSEKESGAVQSGTDKVKVNGEDNKGGDPVEDARIQEIKDMHSRHETEMKAIHKRHQKEDAKKGDSNEKPGAGDTEIEEVKEGKEITE